MTTLTFSDKVGRGWKELQRRAIGLASASGLQARPVRDFAQRDPELPLVALVGLIKAGKSRFLVALAGEAVGSVAAAERSARPVFLGYGDEKIYALRSDDGSERCVEWNEFENALSFDENFNRRSNVANGIVRLPLALLRQLEFVDLPGLAGRHAREIDAEVLAVSSRCPMAFILATKLGEQILRAAITLARQHTALVFVRTKSDLDIRSGDPDETEPQRRFELSELDEHGVIAPIIAVSTVEDLPEYAITKVDKIRNYVGDLVRYYHVATVCELLGRTDSHAKIARELHRQAAGVLALSFGDLGQARWHSSRIESPNGNYLADLLGQHAHRHRRFG